MADWWLSYNFVEKFFIVLSILLMLVLVVFKIGFEIKMNSLKK